MYYKIRENNQVHLVGKIVSGLVLDHTAYEEEFYLADLEVIRLSGKADIVPIMVPGKLLNALDDYTGQMIKIKGQFRSFNYCNGSKRVLKLFVYVSELLFIDDIVDFTKNNSIILDGYICKPPIYRKTPLGREITDILLEVNRPHRKSDYIPCIVWGNNARYASVLSVGKRIKISGRIQSREYSKTLDSDNTITKVCYEVSGIANEEVDVDGQEID